MLDDAVEAERLLAPLESSRQCDSSLHQVLADVYSKLDRPRDLARVAGSLLASSRDKNERERLVLLQAGALARAGDTSGALAVLEPLRRSPEFPGRRAARRARYEVLRQAGRLQAEVASLRDPAERAFVALEVEHNYAEAVRLYRAASSGRPDSLELAQGLREAERHRDLAERRTLYRQVLAKDPEDETTRDKLIAVLAALGEVEPVRQIIGGMLRGRETAPEALLRVALSLKRAGMDGEAGAYLEKAYAAEKDVAKKQQIMFSLGELYAGARQEEHARRLYTQLATDGASTEIRERAVARLASLLR